MSYQQPSIEELQMIDAVLESASSFFSIQHGKQIVISRITQKALQVWTKTWENINDRVPPDGGWDWDYKKKEFEKKYHKYLIDIAVWESDNLCGLCLCSRSKGDDNLTIHYIEGSPNENNPLKGFIFQIIEAVYIEYGKRKSIDKIIISEPVDGLINFYCAENGYKQLKKLFGSKKHLEKGINHDSNNLRQF